MQVIITYHYKISIDGCFPLALHPLSVCSANAVQVGGAGAPRQKTESLWHAFVFLGDSYAIGKVWKFQPLCTLTLELNRVRSGYLIHSDLGCRSLGTSWLWDSCPLFRPGRSVGGGVSSSQNTGGFQQTVESFLTFEAKSNGLCRHKQENSDEKCIPAVEFTLQEINRHKHEVEMHHWEAHGCHNRWALVAHFLFTLVNFLRTCPATLLLHFYISTHDFKTSLQSVPGLTCLLASISAQKEVSLPSRCL